MKPDISSSDLKNLKKLNFELFQFYSSGFSELPIDELIRTLSVSQLN
jgi:hypothetical protein